MMAALSKRVDAWVTNVGSLLLVPLLLVPIFLVSKLSMLPATVVLLLTMVWLIRSTKWTRIFMLLLIALSVLQLGYYLYSGQIIDQFLWMAINSTDYNESLSFFNALGPVNIIILGVYTLALLFCLFCVFRKKNIVDAPERVVTLLVFITAISEVLILYNPTNYIAVHEMARDNFFTAVYQSVMEAKSFNISKAHIRLVKSPAGPAAAEVLVVVGESATRLRMGAYGYSRNTTPLIGKSAYLFKHDVAVGINTQPNAQALLTGLLKMPPGGFDQDIFRMAKLAGYRSVVIDNNAYKNDDPVVRLSMEADQYVSMNGIGQASATNDNKIRYDQVVLKPFLEQIGDRGSAKTLYMVHLIGSHPSQNRRYPANFDKFPSYYDNSILYTDYILSRLKQIFMTNVKGPAVMIYVSDHGVGLPPGCGFGAIPDPENLSYGADDKYFSNYAIPLVVWTNSAFDRERPNIVRNIASNLNKPVDQRFLFYSVASLMGVAKVNGFSVDRLSIFSAKSDFVPRMNVYGANIDTLFQDGKVCVAPSAEPDRSDVVDPPPRGHRATGTVSMRDSRDGTSGRRSEATRTSLRRAVGA